MIAGKFWSYHEIDTTVQSQLLKLLHHHKVSGIEILWECNIKYILPNLTLKPSGSTLCLNSLWHALHQMISSMILKLIPNTDNHLLHGLLRCNMSIFLWNYMFHMCPNVLNWMEIRRIWRMLMTPHSKLCSNRNTHFLVRRSIIFHDNWHLHISKWLLSELLKRSFQNLVSINGEVHILFMFQFKKHTWLYFTYGGGVPTARGSLDPAYDRWNDQERFKRWMRLDWSCRDRKGSLDYEVRS